MILRYFKFYALIALLLSFSFTSTFAGPLHESAYGGGTKTVKLLLAKGANINTKNKRGQTILDYAKVKNNKDTIKLLKKHGAK